MGTRTIPSAVLRDQLGPAYYEGEFNPREFEREQRAYRQGQRQRIQNRARRGLNTRAAAQSALDEIGGGGVWTQPTAQTRAGGGGGAGGVGSGG